MYTLGLNAGIAASHDPAACLLATDGSVIALVEEERPTRVRHAPAQHPIAAIRSCLSIGGIASADVDVVAIGWDIPKMSARRGEPWRASLQEQLLAELDLPTTAEIVFVPHHQAHAMSAFGASPYERAAVLVVDGNGEDESVSIFSADRHSAPTLLCSWPRVTSLGYLYEEVSKWLGFSRLHAGKTMGLAAYGLTKPYPWPGWLDFDSYGLWSVLGDDPQLDYEELRSGWRRQIEQYAGRAGTATSNDLLAGDSLAVQVASVAQATVERCISGLATLARDLAGADALCLAGGVALNCSANGMLDGSVYVPPVPHDAGVSLGAAWTVNPPRADTAFTPYVGNDAGPVPSWLKTAGAIKPLDVDTVLDLVMDGNIGGFCRGRAEAGPRALCHRSILALPTDDAMHARLNSLKGREPWRPFGPVAHAPNNYWAPVGELERYMLGATRVSELGAATLPAVTHTNMTTRPQRLRRLDEPFVFELLNKMDLGGAPPVLLNTSFNGPGEPIVDTAEDALDCAMRLGLDYLVLDNYLVVLGNMTRSAS